MILKQFINKTGTLRVAANNRYLEYTDGTPFFYLADTAWELFHRLSLDEAKLYLKNRAVKGFTVIQAVALGELEGTDTTNANGDLPFINRDPAKPNEAYFDHVDQIAKFAETLGLVIGLLPTWGSYWKQDGRNTTIFNAENAKAYGRYIGARFRKASVIWIMGGDQNVESDGERAVINAMAQGIKEGDEGTHLITYHPRGPGRSAEVLHDESWLDFNMCQSSHGAKDHDNGLFIDADYALDPPKPTVDGEPRYETMPVGFYYGEVSRHVRFDDYDTRQAAYWALLAGACGHTYGHNCVWQMWQPGRDPIIWANIPWQEALDHPGALQMGYARRLFQSRPFQELRPDHSMIIDGPAGGGAKIRAARSHKGTFAFIYSPMGMPFTVNKQVFKAAKLKEIWYDPRYGCAYHIHTTANVAFQTYSPPTSGRGNDWILIMEDETAGFPMP